MAQGVGIRIYCATAAPMTLLANEDSANGSNAEARGWYPAIGSASNKANGEVAAASTSTARPSAPAWKSSALGSKPSVTPGRVEATAQVVIRVQ